MPESRNVLAILKTDPETDAIVEKYIFIYDNHPLSRSKLPVIVERSVADPSLSFSAEDGAIINEGMRKIAQEYRKKNPAE